jgi:hypothetical protein
MWGMRVFEVWRGKWAGLGEVLFTAECGALVLLGAAIGCLPGVAERVFRGLLCGLCLLKLATGSGRGVQEFICL